MTREFRLLCALESDGAMSQRRLCRILAIDKATMVQIIDHLEGLELIQRQTRTIRIKLLVPLRGAVLGLTVSPRVRKERVPGANVLARLWRAQPGGLAGDKPRVERFVRHPGLGVTRRIAPRRGC